MNPRELFNKWWNENGCLGRTSAWELFVKQNKPIAGINSNDIRCWV